MSGDNYHHFYDCGNFFLSVWIVDKITRSDMFSMMEKKKWKEKPSWLVWGGLSFRSKYALDTFQDFLANSLTTALKLVPFVNSRCLLPTWSSIIERFRTARTFTSYNLCNIYIFSHCTCIIFRYAQILVRYLTIFYRLKPLFKKEN